MSEISEKSGKTLDILQKINTCRTCLIESDNLVPLFGTISLPDGDILLKELLLTCASVQVRKKYFS